MQSTWNQDFWAFYTSLNIYLNLLQHFHVVRTLQKCHRLTGMEMIDLWGSWWIWWPDNMQKYIKKSSIQEWTKYCSVCTIIISISWWFLWFPQFHKLYHNMSIVIYFEIGSDVFSWTGLCPWSYSAQCISVGGF